MRKIVAVIGGGAAGMMAAGAAAGNGHTVTLFEKNSRLGRKMLITGKGRCNVTNASSVETHIEHVASNPSFLYSAFYTFDSDATMSFFQNMGLELKVERGNRVFPVSDRAADVVDAMHRYLVQKGVNIRLNKAVSGVKVEQGRVLAVIDAAGKTHPADAVIVATGGLSYPATGSTGDGYSFARDAGHTITALRPSLTPLVAKEGFLRDLQGLSLKNTGVTVIVDGKRLHKDFGELMFTHYGVSGPVVLSLSRVLIGKYEKQPVISLDLKPALSEKELDNRVLRDFSAYSNRDLANSLDDLLPRKMIDVFIERSGIHPRKKVRDITRSDRQALVSLFKNFSFTVCGARGFNEAVITCGGVCVDQVDPGTMGSRVADGLYFAGEVLDVDGYTGGYNLQIAFSTGFLAGISV